MWKDVYEVKRTRLGKKQYGDKIDWKDFEGDGYSSNLVLIKI